MTLLFPFNSGLPARLTAAFLREDLGSQEAERKKSRGEREREGQREGGKETNWNEGVSERELRSEVKSLTGHFVGLRL